MSSNPTMPSAEVRPQCKAARPSAALHAVPDAAGAAPDDRPRLAVSELPVIAVLLDALGHVVAVSDVFEERLGRAGREVHGLSLDALGCAGSAPRVASRIEACSSPGAAIHRAELRVQRGDGCALRVRESLRRVADGAGAPRFLALWEDLGAAQTAASDRRCEDVDSLTGLPSRHALERTLQTYAEAVGARRHGCSLCYVKVGGVAAANEVYGHHAGDAVLRAAARLLRGQAGAARSLGRVSGDEFALVLDGVTPQSALATVRRLCEGASQARVPWNDAVLAFSFTVGVVPVRTGEHGGAGALALAASVCHITKECEPGTARLLGHDDLPLAQYTEQMRWVNRLDAMIEQGRFQLFAQPIVSLAPDARAVASHEVLLRVEHDGILGAPVPVLAAAERNGRACHIDTAVIHKTLDLLEACGGRTPASGGLHLNLSGQSLCDATLADVLAARFANGGIDTTRLVFEVTETAAITNLPYALRFMSRLGEFGCRFALDDFGKGMSSYAYLRDLPVDIVKIDGSFVSELEEHPVNLDLIRSMSDVAHSVGKQVVAEWIDSLETCAVLHRVGVEYGQGFALGRPRPLAWLLAPRAEDPERSRGAPGWPGAQPPPAR